MVNLGVQGMAHSAEQTEVAVVVGMLIGRAQLARTANQGHQRHVMSRNYLLREFAREARMYTFGAAAGPPALGWPNPAVDAPMFDRSTWVFTS